MPGFSDRSSNYVAYFLYRMCMEGGILTVYIIYYSRVISEYQA
jgi:hypothetical protein